MTGVGEEDLERETNEATKYELETMATNETTPLSPPVAVLFMFVECFYVISKYCCCPGVDTCSCEHTRCVHLMCNSINLLHTRMKTPVGCLMLPDSLLQTLYLLARHPLRRQQKYPCQQKRLPQRCHQRRRFPPLSPRHCRRTPRHRPRKCQLHHLQALQSLRQMIQPLLLRIH